MDNFSEIFGSNEESNEPLFQQEEINALDKEIFETSEFPLADTDEFNLLQEERPIFEEEKKKALSPSTNPAAAAVFALAAMLIFGSAAYSITSPGFSPEEEIIPAVEAVNSVEPQPQVPARPKPVPVVDSGPEEVTEQPAAEVEVVFSLEGGRIGDSVMDVFVAAQRGESVTPPAGIVRDGYIFDGWVTSPEGTVPASFDSVNQSFTAYAKWHKGGVVPAVQNPPKVTFKYKWGGDCFHPFADIVWDSQSSDAYIIWQAYDQNGGAFGEGGLFNATDGLIELANYEFAITAPISNGLYPMGCTLRLTPYIYNGTGHEELDDVVMQLPYFEVEAFDGGDGSLSPIISTNVGFYFEHSYDRLNISTDGGALRVTGNIYPVEGERVTLIVDRTAQ